MLSHLFCPRLLPVQAAVVIILSLGAQVQIDQPFLQHLHHAVRVLRLDLFGKGDLQEALGGWGHAVADAGSGLSFFGLTKSTMPLKLRERIKGEKVKVSK